jgi:type I restriction enzyme S subunit
MEQVSRMETLDPDVEYKLLGVRLEGNGAFLRETKRGGAISAKSLCRVMHGDFIYSRLFAWRGAFSIIPLGLDKCYVSNEFPVFRTTSEDIDLRYIQWWFKNPNVWSVVEKDCVGSTPLSRNRFKEDFFLNLQIPLPSKEEQVSISGWLESIQSRCLAACSHIDQVLADSISMLANMAERSDLSESDKIDDGWEEMALGDILSSQEDWHVVVAGENYPNAGILNRGRGMFPKGPINGSESSATQLNKIRAGQFIYSRLFAFEGSYTIVPPELDGRYVSNEFPTFSCKLDRVLPEFLAAAFRSPIRWAALAEDSVGLGMRRQRIQPHAILAHRMWIPPMNYQMNVRQIWQRVNGMIRACDKIRDDANALLSSALAQVFRSEKGQIMRTTA